MTYFYTAQKKYGLYRAVVYHWSTLEEDEVLDYISRESFDNSSEAYDAAREWAENNVHDGEVEMD